LDPFPVCVLLAGVVEVAGSGLHLRDARQDAGAALGLAFFGRLELDCSLRHGLLSSW
jgi:hypothetical protein